MVVSLKPWKFYGSSLPRPRYYTDIKFSDERVDPPVPVLDPLMSWAEEAHWSMGGLSFNRLRLQGKIEGNVKKLKKEREVTWNKKMENSTPESKPGVGARGRKVGGSGESPPPVPISKKRRPRKIVDPLEDEEEFDDEYDSEVEEIEFGVEKNGGMKKKKRRLVRKLGDDFELVGVESGKNGKSPLKDLSNDGVPNGIASRTRTRIRGRRTMVLKDDEEEEGDSDDETMIKGKKNGVEKNGNIEKIKEKSVSLTPKKNKGKSSVSPSGSRSSPRLKQNST